MSTVDLRAIEQSRIDAIRAAFPGDANRQTRIAAIISGLSVEEFLKRRSANAA